MSDPLAELDGLLLDLKLKAKEKEFGKSSPSSSSSSYTPSSSSSSSSASTSSPQAPKSTPVSASYATPSFSSPSTSTASGPSRQVTTNLSLGDQESLLFREINNVRKNPQEYANILEKERKPFFEGRMLKKPNTKIALMTAEGVSAVDEAIRALRDQSPLPELTVSYGLTLAAREAVRELNDADDQIDSVHRLYKYGDFEEQAVEIASFSRPPFDAREHVVRLLVGDGNQMREHRNHILSPVFRVVGVAVTEVPRGPESVVALINFTKRFIDK